jgi:hypothetical protein
VWLRRRSVLLAGALALVGAACTGSTTTAGTPTKAGPERHTRSSKGPGCQYIVAGTAKRFTTRGTKLQYLTDATAEPATCYDKITFTFNRGDAPDLPPGYTVEYAKPPFAPFTRSTTEGFKQAKAVLKVTMGPADQFDTRRPGAKKQTYGGNLRLLIPKQVRHVVIVEFLNNVPDLTPTDQTDNSVIWLIGLDEKRPFTVDAYNQPPDTTIVSVLVMH